MHLRGLLGRTIRGRTDTRVRSTWRVVGPVLAALCVQYAGILAVITLLPAASAESPSMGRAALVASGMGLTVVGSAVAALAVSRRLDRRTYAAYWSHEPGAWVRDLFGGLAIGMAAIAVAIAYLLVAGHARLVTATPTSSASTPALVAFVAVVFLYLVANVMMEEVVFRGIVLQNVAEGLADRSVPPGYAAVGALVASSLVFGLFHGIAPGSGSGLDVILTSTGVGVLLATGYLLAGNLSLPIGIHLGGGLVFFALTQEQLLGHTVPTVLELQQVTQGPEATYGILLCRVVSGLVLVSLWVALTRGELSIDERVLRWDARIGDQR